MYYIDTHDMLVIGFASNYAHKNTREKKKSKMDIEWLYKNLRRWIVSTNSFSFLQVNKWQVTPKKLKECSAATKTFLRLYSTHFTHKFKSKIIKSKKAKATVRFASYYASKAIPVWCWLPMKTNSTICLRYKRTTKHYWMHEKKKNTKNINIILGLYHHRIH